MDWASIRDELEARLTRVLQVRRQVYTICRGFHCLRVSVSAHETGPYVDLSSRSRTCRRCQQREEEASRSIAERKHVVDILASREDLKVNVDQLCAKDEAARYLPPSQLRLTPGRHGYSGLTSFYVRNWEWTAVAGV
jgi:hypothetical protein